jgi:predicted lipoprotein with Yx(FWY)xxD motif
MTLRSRRTLPLVLLVAAAPPAALAAAHHAPAAVVRAARNASLGRTVVVDAHARTLYALSSESASELKCISSTCTANWPPLTVRSRRSLHAGHGVHGRLSVVRRPDGTLQVALRGMPLYRFAGDSRRGQANGDGVAAFGGAWHAVPASASRASSPPAASPPPTSTTPTTTDTRPSGPIPYPYPPGY